MATTTKPGAVALAETYYDSRDADTFYRTVWGGEDIHIGLYETPGQDIAEASRRTVEAIAGMLQGAGPDTAILDIGAGYGGSARYLAETFGCHVTCLNLSDVQNAHNQRLNEKQGLSRRIAVVHGNFEAIPGPAAAYDVVWSQDAILHSGNRRRVLEQVARVLRPGGTFIFTDPMQSDDCPPGVLKPILDRIHLATLGSPGFYRATLAELGFREVRFVPMVEHLRHHYHRVGQDLKARRAALGQSVSDAYVETMLRGLQHWVDGADRGYLTWGIFQFEKAR